MDRAKRKHGICFYHRCNRRADIRYVIPDEEGGYVQLYCKMHWDKIRNLQDEKTGRKLLAICDDLVGKIGGKR